jgi:hypothetical protein
VTETRRGAGHVATRWHLASRHRAPWKWIPRALGYHIALTLALAVAPLAVGTGGEHAFITQFLACWGGASGGAPRQRRTKRRRI